MKRQLYPAVLKRGSRARSARGFPTSRRVAGGKSQEEAIAKAENTLAQAVDVLAERE